MSCWVNEGAITAVAATAEDEEEEEEEKEKKRKKKQKGNNSNLKDRIRQKKNSIIYAFVEPTAVAQDMGNNHNKCVNIGSGNDNKCNASEAILSHQQQLQQ